LWVYVLLRATGRLVMDIDKLMDIAKYTNPLKNLEVDGGIIFDKSKEPKQAVGVLLSVDNNVLRNFLETNVPGDVGFLIDQYKEDENGS